MSEIKIEGDAENKFITGYDDPKNPKVAYLAIPLKRVLGEGRFGQVVLIGEIDIFRREVEHVLGMLSAEKQATGVITDLKVH